MIPKKEGDWYEKEAMAIYHYCIAFCVAECSVCRGHRKRSRSLADCKPRPVKCYQELPWAEHADKHFKLISDIDLGLSGWGYWVPIGWNTPFYGSLDGDSHTVSNMTINTLHNGKAGFIGTATNASITNLTLSALSISASAEYGIEAGGLVVISNNSTVDNCRVSGNIGLGNDGNPDFYVAFAGGLVGKQNLASVVSNSSSACSTISSAYVRLDLMPGISISMQNIGGLIGQNFGTITNSYSNGVVISTIENNYSLPEFITVATGGVAGSNEGSITNCYSSSQVHGMSGLEVGRMQLWANSTVLC
jgi:hypothetical protein